MHPFLGAFAPSFTVINTGATTATYTTIGVSSAATAYNNSTPTQLLASTAYDAHSFSFRMPLINSTGVRTSTVFEVMAGSAGNEYSIIGPIPVGHHGGVTWLSVPIFIPAGTRLSARVRSARTSFSFSCSFGLGYGVSRDSVGLPTRWVAYGVTDDASANAQGTIVAPGNAAWGSWTAITTSTTYAHDLWIPMVDGGTAATMTALTTRTQFAFASTTAAATAATNLTMREGPMVRTSTSEDMGDATQSAVSGNAFIFGGTHPNYGISYQPMAAGSAISARALCSGAPDANALGLSVLAAL